MFFRNLGFDSAPILAWASMPAQTRAGNLIALAAFIHTNGDNPQASVTLDANGDLLGTAYDCGATNQWAMLELAKGSNTITVQGSYNGTNRAFPLGGVTLDANGNLFGTAATGGGSTDGTVWEFHTSPSVVPEPSSLVLGFIAMVFLPLVLRRFF
jgi:hypothetical protein